MTLWDSQLLRTKGWHKSIQTVNQRPGNTNNYQIGCRYFISKKPEDNGTMICEKITLYLHFHLPPNSISSEDRKKLIGEEWTFYKEVGNNEYRRKKNNYQGNRAESSLIDLILRFWRTVLLGKNEALMERIYVWTL